MTSKKEDFLEDMCFIFFLLVGGGVTKVYSIICTFDT